MPAPLIAPRWRGGALVAIVVAVAVTSLLAVLVHHEASTRFDTWVLRTAYRHIDIDGAHALIKVASPLLSIGVLVAVTVGALIARRWDLAILAVAGPVVAELITELILKPAVGRLIGPYVYRGGSLAGAITGSFPSGHETGIAAAALVLFIVAVQLRVGRAVRVLVAVFLTVWTLVAALALVRNSYHYATDTIGAVAVSIAAVLAIALSMDRWVAPVLERMDVRRRQLT